jgi:hypothetical protein
MVVNMSLVEQTLSRGLHVYWLRVGAVLEEDLVGGTGSSEPPPVPLVPPVTSASASVSKAPRMGQQPPQPPCPQNSEAEASQRQQQQQDNEGGLTGDGGAAPQAHAGSREYEQKEEEGEEEGATQVGEIVVPEGEEMQAAVEEEEGREGDGDGNGNGNGDGDSYGGSGGEVLEGRMHTLAVLSSDAAKFMVPSMDDWVDLGSVRSWNI